MSESPETIYINLKTHKWSTKKTKHSVEYVRADRANSYEEEACPECEERTVSYCYDGMDHYYQCNCGEAWGSDEWHDLTDGEQ